MLRISRRVWHTILANLIAMFVLVFFAFLAVAYDVSGWALFVLFVGLAIVVPVTGLTLLCVRVWKEPRLHNKDQALLIGAWARERIKRRIVVFHFLLLGSAATLYYYGLFHVVESTKGDQGESGYHSATGHIMLGGVLLICFFLVWQVWRRPKLARLPLVETESENDAPPQEDSASTQNG